MVHLKDETQNTETYIWIFHSLNEANNKQKKESERKEEKKREKQIKRHFDQITAYQSVGSVLLKAEVKWARA